MKTARPNFACSCRPAFTPSAAWGRADWSPCHEPVILVDQRRGPFRRPARRYRPTRWNQLENDQYFTIESAWIIPALLSKAKITGPVLEPAAGVGHMVRELRRGHGLEVIGNDLHVYEDPLVPDIGVQDIRAINSLQGFKNGSSPNPAANSCTSIPTSPASFI